MLKFKTLDGRKLKFDDKPFKDGGEGILYKQYDESGHGDIGYLAKTFKDGKGDGKEKKLKAMLSISSPEPSYSYTWPQEILYDADTGEFCGYSMYLQYKKKELLDVYTANSQFHKIHDWLFFVTAAKNLAQAVMGVHSINQVIGDLNGKNIFIDTDNAEVTLIDCDSFHITVGDSKNTVVHRCSVGMHGFVAPEILGKNFREDDLPTFTESTDNFSLAILICKLLMNGLEPFYSGQLNDNTDKENIKQGKSPYFMKLKKGEVAEPPYAPPVDMLPRRLRDLFKRAFIDGATPPNKRPSAKEFYDALDSMLEDKNVKTCVKVKNHKFPANASECPWCLVDAKMNNLPRILSGQANDSAPKQSTNRAQSKDYGDVAPVIPISARDNTPPVAFPKPKPKPKSTSAGGNTSTPEAKNNVLAIITCILILLATFAVIVTGYLTRIPWLFIALAVIADTTAILRLPKVDYGNSCDSKLPVPGYLMIPFQQVEQEKKSFLFYTTTVPTTVTRFALFPKWKLWIFNTLCLSVLLSLGALIIVGVFLLLSNLWTFAGLTLLGVFGTMLVLEKRTLWTKSKLGVIMGIIGILAVLANLGFLINLLI